MAKTRFVNVQGHKVNFTIIDDEDFICLTDMAKVKGDVSRAIDIIKNWLRSRNTLEFLGAWEGLHNPDFKVVEFDHFRNQSGLNSFVLNPQTFVEKNQQL